MMGLRKRLESLLRDIKSTLESLNKLHATAIREIGEYNLELGLPNDEIEDLREQMKEGAKLVCKLSNFRVWNYCCINCYTDQLVDLDRSLKRLLENLKLQETRDVKEILDLLRKYRIELDELKVMLKMLLEQRRGDVMETSTSTAGSSTETMRQQSEASLGGGADLGAAYRMLLIVVTDVKDKSIMFRPLLGDLKAMLDSLKPLIEEIAEHDKLLVDRRYNHYCEQMQMVVNAFDLVMGFRAAVPYTALAQKAMSRHFRCLKDAVTAQLKHSCELLGEKDGAGNSGITKGETPRLKMLEQSLRQQRAFHQMGMMEQEAWRPQRGLPERSVNILRAWLFEHFLHPYPSDADKQLLAQRTGLSRCQVSSWFVNARVRLWKPLVEQMFQQEADEEGDVAAASVDQDQMSEQCYNTSDYPAETPMPPATTTSM